MLEGLAPLILDIDKAIEIIRATKKDSEVVQNLCVFQKLDDIQANFVADIKLRNINEEYLLNKLNQKR